MSVLPQIGSRGTYTFYHPFTAYSNRLYYTCTGIITINEFIETGRDAKSIIYIKYGILSQYDEDIANNIKLVILSSDTGSHLYVPEQYIATLPMIDGVSYVGMMLTVDIGAMPVLQDYSVVNNAIIDSIKETLGVTCVIRQVEVTEVEIIAKQEHRLIQLARQRMMDTFANYKVKYLLLLDSYNIALLKIKALETYIRQCLCRTGVLGSSCVVTVDTVVDAMQFNIFARSIDPADNYDVTTSRFFTLQDREISVKKR
jgi:hypothetical protein